MSNLTFPVNRDEQVPKPRGQRSRAGWLYMREAIIANMDNQVTHSHTHTHTFTLLLLPLTHQSHRSRLNNELCESDKVTTEERYRKLVGEEEGGRAGLGIERRSNYREAGEDGRRN